MKSIFVTGFPGFLASALIPRLADRIGVDCRIDCIVERRFQERAIQRASAIERSLGRPIHVLVGDITQPDLGLGDARAEAVSDCTEVYHLAAVYDLAVPLDLATRVNVDGTRHVVAFAADCRHLSRLHHISTCYVSGKHPGVFRETDLDVGQRFGNHYESTKYLSEVIVHDNALIGLPTTIYRPSIVGGDSSSGETQKLDGPYFFIQWLLAQPQFAVLPRFAGARDATMNIVPSDYVTQAIAYLSARQDAPLKVYSLADPTPLTIRNLTMALALATDRRVLRIPATRSLARALIRLVCAMHPTLNIPPEAVDYLGHPTHYDCSNTLADLSGSGISCPPLQSYLHRMVSFVHAGIGPDAAAAR